MVSKLLRVTQLDAIQLDNEFMKLLKSTFEESVQYLSPGFTVPFEPEINLIIKLLVLNNSIMRNSATFGQALLLIKYDNLSTTKKLFYLIFSCCNYIKTRCELSDPAHNINKYFNIAEFIIQICAFINLSIFLKMGTKPSLTDRVLGLNQVYVKTIMPRKFNNKYLAREVLWNGLSEVLIFTLPLINVHKIKRIFRSTQKFRKNPQIRNEKPIYNLHSTCPHCSESPIQPHHMGCVHVFCYICLKANQLADNKYECPVCGYNGMICERLVI